MARRRSKARKEPKQLAEPNLSRLSRYAADEDVVLIPGKLLGSGDVAGKPSVAAYSVSTGARSKIEAAGGRVHDP